MYVGFGIENRTLVKQRRRLATVQGVGITGWVILVNILLFIVLWLRNKTEPTYVSSR